MSVIFTSKDISKKLKIGKSQVREISKQLEKEAYKFTKNQETRIYSEKDFTLIQMVLENYNKHQNLPQAVQYVLSKLQQNSEITNLEEIPSSELTIEVDEQPEASLNNVQVVDPIEASLNNIELFDQSEVSSNKIKATDHVEVSLNNIELFDQSEISSNKTIDADHIVPSISNDHIVSSSSKVDVVDQKSASYHIETERLLKNEVQNSVEQQELIEKLQHIDINGTQLQQIDEKVGSQKIVGIDGQSHSNQIMFEEFMSQISNLATQNELILQQNQTLIQQNLLKDQKLEKILHSVEEKSEELQELASVIEEKDEKLEQMFEEIQVREVGRDAQLMRMIREMQETKKMVAASKEKDWKSSLKSFFAKPKTIK